MNLLDALLSSDDLVGKHLGYVTLGKIDQSLSSLPRAVADELKSRGITAIPSLPERVITDALERDLERKYDDALRRGHFLPLTRIGILGGNPPDEFEALGNQILDGTYDAVSMALRRRVLLRASRTASVRKKPNEAERFLNVALGLQGSDSGVPAQARLAAAKGDIDSAIRLLKGETDIESRSTLLSIIVTARGIAAGLKWLEEVSLTPAQLSSTGLHALASAYLREEDSDSLVQLLTPLSEDHLKTCPFLFLLAALAAVASIMPKPDQSLVFQTFQLVVRDLHPILPESVVSERLSVALADLARVAPVLTELALPEVKRIADNLRIWCELLHPQLHTAAVKRLRNDMLDPATALPRVHFAFAFDPDFDPAPIEQHLLRRTEIGGLDEIELRAALTLKLNQNNPREIADLIARHRASFNSLLPPPLIASIEIQALIKTGDTKAGRDLIDLHKNDFTPSFLKYLEAEIQKADGADPFAVQVRLFEETSATEALRSLVEMLIRAKDDRQVASYAEELYSRTRNPEDIALAAQAAARTGDRKSFVRIIEAHPFLEEHDPAFSLHRARILFHAGQLREAGTLIDKASKAIPPKRDLDLEIRVAIASGNWEALSRTLAAFLDQPLEYTPLALMQAAHLSQASDQGPMRDLLQAALSRAGNDPNIWLGAYTLTIEGDEDEGNSSDAAEWFRKALDLSGEDGPIKRFELKDLLPQQIEWNERSKKVNEGISSGDVPLAIAAPALRTTVVDIVLRNLVRNAALHDPRRRAGIPLFSGVRRPETIGNCKRLALDVTSLLVLGWLGLLPKVIANYPEVVVSLGALQEIFDGQRRMRQFQRSRFRRAEEIQRAIARGKIKIIRGIPKQQDMLSTEVGMETAAFMRAAKAADGIVLRPAPLHRPGLDQIPANVDGWADVLADMHALVSVLSGLGTIDQKLEETSKRYFEVQDKGWPTSARPDPSRPLFIDSLALAYLQQTALLDPVLNHFDQIFIEEDSEEEGKILIDYQANINEVLATITGIRICLREAFDAGRLSFAPMALINDDEEQDRTQSSTVNLLSNLLGADAVVFDDRAFNKEGFAQDNMGHRARCISTLDIIEDLYSTEVISEDERRNVRHRLRTAGALLMPIDTQEVLVSAQRSTERESAEFRALRDSCDLAKVTAMPRFPTDIPWFARLWTVPKAAIVEIWKATSDPKRAATLSSLILDVKPSAREWLSNWGTNPPPDWAAAIETVSLAGFALPAELSGEALKGYNDWVDQTIFDELRRNEPKMYGAVVNQVRSFVLRIAERENEDIEG
jgi:hypothetical protein